MVQSWLQAEIRRIGSSGHIEIKLCYFNVDFYLNCFSKKKKNKKKTKIFLEPVNGHIIWTSERGDYILVTLTPF